MNKRKLKKALKKAGARALVAHNMHLMEENAALRRKNEDAYNGLREIDRTTKATIGAIARVYGDKVDGVSTVAVSIEDVSRVCREYETKCAIKDRRFVFTVIPMVDPDAN